MWNVIWWQESSVLVIDMSVEVPYTACGLFWQASEGKWYWCDCVYSLHYAGISSNTVIIYLMCAGEFPRGKSPVICGWTWHEGQGGTCTEENWQHTAGQSGLQLLWLAGQLYLRQVQFRCSEQDAGFFTDCVNVQIIVHCVIPLHTKP